MKTQKSSPHFIKKLFKSNSKDLYPKTSLILARHFTFSVGGNLGCVVNIQSGSDYYVGLYNFDTTVDGAATRRYICLVKLLVIASDYVTSWSYYGVYKQWENGT